MEGRFGFSATMETQSGNGEEVVTAVSAASGSVSRSPPDSQVETSDEDPARGEDLQAGKRIERFHIPLDSLKRMFEKPAGAKTVSTATVHVPWFRINILLR